MLRMARSRFILAVLLVTVAGAPAIAGPNEDILSASKVGDRAAVEAALAGGASVNARNEKNFTPLAIAAANDHNNVAALLLTRGANLEAADVVGQTALHHAATNGSTEVARLLAAQRVDVDTLDPDGPKSTVAGL
jgi:ankyrin repeat protein